MPTKWYWHPRIFRPSDGPDCLLSNSKKFTLHTWPLCKLVSTRIFSAFFNICQIADSTCRTEGQIPPKCKETSNFIWFSLIWFILVLFVCWNLFYTKAKLRIRCVTETKNASGLFYKNLISSFFTWLTHLTLSFLYILGSSGTGCTVS